MNPFEYVKAINTSKKNIIIDDISEKEYPPFLVNRSLSYFQDTILYANEMNINHHIDHRLQFDFFINIIRKKNRFSKWLKPTEIDNIEIIKEYYGYSNDKAKSVLTLFDKESIDVLRQRIYKGGRSK